MRRLRLLAADPCLFWGPERHVNTIFPKPAPPFGTNIIIARTFAQDAAAPVPRQLRKIVVGFHTAQSVTMAANGASSISVTVRVRPFTIREAAQLSKGDDQTLFLGDGSLAAAPTPKLHSKGIRSVIKVVDEKCLYGS
jgi:hypothetical protein